MKRLLVMILLVGSTAMAVAGQEAVWPLVERCLPSAEDGRTYSGTILLGARSGYYTVSAADTASHPLVSTDQLLSDGYSYMSSPLLSPNGDWLAVFRGTAVRDEVTTTFTILEVLVLNTRDPLQTFHLDWQNSWILNWGTRVAYWIDNERLLYEYSELPQPTPYDFRVLNPFTSEVSAWDGVIDVTNAGNYAWYSPSPDFTQTLAINPGMGGDAPQISLQDTRNWAHIPLPDLTFASTVNAWSPDGRSLAMVAEGPVLITVDSQNETYTPIFEMEDGTFYSSNSLAWSPDSRFLSFVMRYGESDKRLYLADIASEIVYDTCVDVDDAVVWSPASEQIALLETNEGQSVEIMLLDVASWQLHRAAVHMPVSENDLDTRVIGWRSDD